LELDVIEDGPGFPRECLPRAWNRFSRAGSEAGYESKAPRAEARHASTTAKPGQSRAELTVTDAAGNKSRTGSVSFPVLKKKKRPQP
jgi:hypothetical protein